MTTTGEENVGLFQQVNKHSSVFSSFLFFISPPSSFLSTPLPISFHSSPYSLRQFPSPGPLYLFTSLEKRSLSLVHSFPVSPCRNRSSSGINFLFSNEVIKGMRICTDWWYCLSVCAFWEGFLAVGSKLLSAFSLLGIAPIKTATEMCPGHYKTKYSSDFAWYC